ncbi:MAG: Fic family protein [Deltaproteobacteria bacterium]|nr:Fic family protein [Deltaproteobacteria bacterium]
MNINGYKLVGYSNLIQQYNLKALPNWHSSAVSQIGAPQTTIHEDGQVESIYPMSYWPGDNLGDQLEFALKYDGINLGILSSLFEVASTVELKNWINSKPTGKYSRKSWFLFEFLTGSELFLPDLAKGNYIELLDSDQYFTTTPGLPSRRQRIINNLLGVKNFCPIIRRTKELAIMDDINLHKQYDEVTSSYSPEILSRTMKYLYTKETKSTLAIENLTAAISRTEKFVRLLEEAGHEDFCVKDRLINLQNNIVEQRFVETDYRTIQNYVGETFKNYREKVHYICPKPDDIQELMSGLLSANKIMINGAVPAIVHTAAISFGFVFLHPFVDGNGRIHRLLIHNILHQRGEIPKGVMFPVSAAMLNDINRYDHSLEIFSKPLISLIEYDIDSIGNLTVTGETARLYKYIDMTHQTEALLHFIKRTIDSELVEELDFLKKYDKTSEAIQNILDMPNRLIDLFINICLDNRGHISANKRKKLFSFLTDEEMLAMEKAFHDGFDSQNNYS